MLGRQTTAPGAARKHTIYPDDAIGGAFGIEGDATLPADLVRWISGTFFVLFVASTVLFFPRPDRRATRVVRASHPLSLVTGPLWAAILVVVFLALLVEAIVPDWVYGGALTVPVPLGSVLQGVGIVLLLAGPTQATRRRSVAEHPSGYRTTLTFLSADGTICMCGYANATRVSPENFSRIRFTSRVRYAPFAKTGQK